MQLGTLFTVQSDLVDSSIIEIEVDISTRGIPSFSIVGMADKAIEESKERISTALKNCGLGKPKQKKIVVSLSPADIKKEGPSFDLPIALGLLLADEENTIEFKTVNKIFIGELALNGSVKPIKGALSAAYKAAQAGYDEIYLPAVNAQEASLITSISVYGVSSILELVQHLEQENAEVPNADYVLKPTVYKKIKENKNASVDFSHVIEQTRVKRALEIAAAGGHNVAMYGPPGTGKTMLAKAFCSILPPLSKIEQIETTMIHSCAGTLTGPIVINPPLRAPHHTSSYVAVIGGGAYPKPGEATLAHNGVLFLDEFPEFDKRVLESLREPLEDGVVRIARSKASVTFPANFILLAALNPPSEVYRSGSLITPADERKFKKKISGPIMDRIDIWIEVPKIKHDKLLSKNSNEETSATVLSRVVQARVHQATRQGLLNSSIQPHKLSAVASLEPEAKNILDEACSKLHVSPRVYHKLIKLGRTIADLESSKTITTSHVLEALQYRPKDII